MDNLRFVLFVAFSFLLFMLWEAWQQDYGPKPEIPVQSQAVSPQGPGSADLPDAVHAPDAPPAAGIGGVHDLPAAGSAPEHQRISVQTDTLKLEIDTLGGDIHVIDLLDYPQDKEQPDQPVRLLDQSDEKLFISQTGFISSSPAPNHHSLFHAQATRYVLEDGADNLEVPLTWSENGITVTKIYTFQRGSYLVGLNQTVSNQSGASWRGSPYLQLQRQPPSSENSSMFIRTYTGGVVYSEEKKYEKVSFDDMSGSNLNRKTPGGWAAMIQHYFLAAWIPEAEQENTFYTKALADNRYVIGAYSPQREVAPGSEQVFQARLFAGPKLQHQLETVSPGLELTVDYGILTFLGKPIFWLLENFHSLVSNWGGAIILTTLIIKLFFFPLSAASYRSMANMRKLQPRLQALRERCGDDKQRMNQEIMALYRKEKVNPLGGCLPILLQIPVFIALYWVLIESVELRQAPFFLWINDLSSKDPFFLLPLLMGISMFIQQKLNPAPVDPIQEKVMKLFPWIFTVFFAFFPAGLVLYWVVNNTLSILQQWYITRQIEAAS